MNELQYDEELIEEKELPEGAKKVIMEKIKSIGNSLKDFNSLGKPKNNFDKLENLKKVNIQSNEG